MKKVVLISLFALMAVGCNLNQDPLAHETENIRNGVPPDIGNQKPTPDPLFSDSLRVDQSAADFLFQETVESAYTVSGRALVASSDPQLFIENMDEFPGATFDSTTGVFKWTPVRGFTSGDLIRKLNLKINFSVLVDNTDTRIAKIVEVPVIIRLKAGQPVITRVDDLNGTPIVEGSRKVFYVHVKDEDSMATEAPEVLVLPTDRINSSNASGMVYLAEKDPVVDNNDKTLWKFKFAVDTGNMELTKNEEVYSFKLVAVSRYGVKSQDQTVNVKFRTDVTDPVATMEDKTIIEFYAEEESQLSFVALDPKQEGKLTVTLGNLDSLVGYKAYTCDPGKNLSTVHCYLKLKPDVSMVGKTFNWQVKMINKSPIFNDSSTKAVNNTYQIKVLPSRVVTPRPPLTPNEPTPPQDFEDGGQND